MRPRTRNAVAVVLATLVVLLALGALPGFLKSGDPFYLEATAVADDPGRAAVNASTLSDRRYPFATGALAAAADGAGRSDPYWKGPVGLKGAFTHSPFDELSALRQQHPDATTAEAAYVRRNGTLYRLTVVRE